MCNHYRTSHFPWFHPGWQHSPTQPLTRPLIQWDGERVRKVKLQKFMGWDTDKLIGKKMGWGEKNHSKTRQRSKKQNKKPQVMQKKAISHQPVPSPCMALLQWEFKYTRKAQQEEKERKKPTPFIFLVYETGYFKLADGLFNQTDGG